MKYYTCRALRAPLLLISATFIAVLCIGAAAHAATTIGTDIQTDGMLSVTGTTTLTGNVGIATTTPGSALTVVGYIQQAVGGGSTVAINPFSINYTDKYFSADTLINGTIGNSGSDQASVIIGGSSTGGNGDAGNAYFNTVVGFGAETTAVDGNTAIGAFAETLGPAAGNGDLTAIGRNSTASSTTGAAGSVALGVRTAALGDASMALGYYASASGSHSLALGPGVAETADNTFVYGSIGTRNGFGTTSPVANLQVANGNATTTMEIGSAGENKGSCLKLYRTDGTPIYAYVAAGATTFTLTTASCANVSNF